MADPFPQTPPAPPTLLPEGTPTIFADGLYNIANSPNVVKFYLTRFDPSLSADGPNLQVAVAQIVMPIDNFIGTIIFLEQALKEYVAGGVVSEERLDEFRALVAGQDVKWGGYIKLFFRCTV